VKAATPGAWASRTMIVASEVKNHRLMPQARENLMAGCPGKRVQAKSDGGGPLGAGSPQPLSCDYRKPQADVKAMNGGWEICFKDADCTQAEVVAKQSAEWINRTTTQIGCLC